MPWLWDFPSTDQPRDWFSTYQELRRQCFATTPERDPSGQTVLGERDGSLVLGLANRRRVWMACEQVAKVYLEQKVYADDNGNSEIGEGVSLQMPLVADKSKDTQSLHTQFLSSWEDLKKKVRFLFYFRDDGRLCGVEMMFVEAGYQKIFGIRARESVEVAVPGETWIEGVEFNICDADNLIDHAKLGISGLKVYNNHSCLPPPTIRMTEAVISLSNTYADLLSRSISGMARRSKSKRATVLNAR